MLAARLEEVAAAASERLLKMTSGRYSLVHTDARRGAGRSGLGLLACDSWTGVDRDTSTLSGGETFLASLALALGLADVVTAEAGGTRIEALFVDEGFGSLDEDTLEEVMTVLDGLREGGRMVGIVSHVAELRQRIPAQVRVRKARPAATSRSSRASRSGRRAAVTPGRHPRNSVLNAARRPLWLNSSQMIISIELSNCDIRNIAWLTGKQLGKVSAWVSCDARSRITIKPWIERKP